jgi:hypothetical protein
MMSDVGRFLILGAAWTAVVLAVLLLWPSGVDTPGCAHLVTPSAACLGQLADLNDRAWWTRTLPLLAFVASGYVVLAVAAARHRRRSRGRPNPTPRSERPLTILDGPAPGNGQEQGERQVGENEHHDDPDHQRGQAQTSSPSVCLLAML